MKEISIDIFSATVYLYIGKKEALQYIKSSKKLGYKPNASGLGEVAGFLIWVKNLKDISVIVHEISHLVDNILDYYSVNDREMKAFLSEYLYRRIISKI